MSYGREKKKKMQTSEEIPCVCLVFWLYHFLGLGHSKLLSVLHIPVGSWSVEMPTIAPHR